MVVRMSVLPKYLMALVVALASLGAIVVTAESSRADVDPGLPAPVDVAAVPVVAGLRVTWSPPADASTVTGYHVSTPEGFDRVVGADADELVVDVASPGNTVAVAVAAVHGPDESSPVAASGAALSPGGTQRALKTPVKLAEATVGTKTTVVKVVGRAGVPLSGVRTAVLLVRVGGATRAITAQVGSGTGRTSISVAAGDTRVRVLTLPVGASGVPVRTTAGTARVRVDVLGWTMSAAASATAEAGRVVVGAPATVLASTSVAKGATRTLAVLGKGVVPTSGVAAVLVTLRTVAGSSRASVAVGPSGTTPTVPVVASPARATESVTLPVTLGADGKVRIRNLGTSGVTVGAQVSGWIGDGTAGGADGVGAWTNDAAPVTVLSARRPVGSVKVAVAGRGAVPGTLTASPAQAVLVRATLAGTTATARPALVLGASGTSGGLPVAVATGTRAVTTTAWVDLGTDGAVTTTVSGATGVVRLDVLAWTVERPTLTADALVLPGAEAAKYDGIETGSGTVTAPTVVPTVGRVLVAGPSATHPAGFLRRVTAVQPQGAGVYDVTTEPAELVDAIRNASVARSTPLSGPVVTDPGDASVSRARPRRRIGVGWTVTRTFDHEVEVVDGGTFGLAGTAQFGAENNLSLDIGWRGVKAEVSTTASEALHLQASASAELSASASVNLGTIRFTTFVVQVGPVPVVITPTATLHLDAEASVSASYAVSLDQSSSGTVGVRYDDGVEAIKQFDDNPPTLTSAGQPPSVNVTASLGVDVALSFYGGVASAGIGLSAGAESGFAVGSCFVENDAFLDASVFATVDLPIVDDLEISKSFRLKEWDLKDVRVPGDSGCPWTGIVEISSGWNGNGTVYDPPPSDYFARAGTTTASLRRVSPEDSRDGHWEGHAANTNLFITAYNPCAHSSTGQLTLDPAAPDTSTDQLQYVPGNGWSLGFTSLDAGSTSHDNGSCGSDVYPHFVWNEDAGVSLLLSHVAEVLTPNTPTTMDRTFTYDVDTPTCGGLPAPSSPHWCQGVSDADEYDQAGRISIHIRMTTLEDLDADGIPDADQNP